MNAADLHFSSEHKAQFQALLEIGELHAFNYHPEKLDFGPWGTRSELGDADLSNRLRFRFRAAARKAAIAAGAPYRANLQDWWIRKLARGARTPYIRELFRRSVEQCEELESRSVEVTPTSNEARGPLGLSRDRYPCDHPTPYFLYTNPGHQLLGDADEEFAYWGQFIWEHFNGTADALVQYFPAKRRRWIDVQGTKHDETHEETRRRVRERVNPRLKSGCKECMHRALRRVGRDELDALLARAEDWEAGSLHVDYRA